MNRKFLRYRVLIIVGLIIINASLFYGYLKPDCGCGCCVGGYNFSFTENIKHSHFTTFIQYLLELDKPRPYYCRWAGCSRGSKRVFIDLIGMGGTLSLIGVILKKSS